MYVLSVPLGRLGNAIFRHFASVLFSVFIPSMAQDFLILQGSMVRSDASQYWRCAHTQRRRRDIFSVWQETLNAFIISML